jgi:hypothetical protein
MVPVVIQLLRLAVAVYNCEKGGEAVTTGDKAEDSPIAGDQLTLLALLLATTVMEVPRQIVVLVGLMLKVGNGVTMTLTFSGALLQPSEAPCTK